MKKRRQQEDSRITKFITRFGSGKQERRRESGAVEFRPRCIIPCVVMCMYVYECNETADAISSIRKESPCCRDPSNHWSCSSYVCSSPPTFHATGPQPTAVVQCTWSHLVRSPTHPPYLLVESRSHAPKDCSHDTMVLHRAHHIFSRSLRTAEHYSSRTRCISVTCIAERCSSLRQLHTQTHTHYTYTHIHIGGTQMGTNNAADPCVRSV